MVKGPFNMLGYYGNAAATKETIEPDGWLHSGDLCKMDAEGYFYIVDRKKDMILTAGYNIYPAEIERVIAGHPSVAMVGVGAKPDAAKGEIAKAYIVLKSGADADPDGILDYCRQHLAAYKMPREVQFVPTLPTTSSGKIMRRQLKTLDQDTPVEADSARRRVGAASAVRPDCKGEERQHEAGSCSRSRSQGVGVEGIRCAVGDECSCLAHLDFCGQRQSPAIRRLTLGSAARPVPSTRAPASPGNRECRRRGG